MEKHYSDIFNAVRDAKKWPCLWLFRNDKAIPVWWKISQTGRKSADCDGLFSIAGKVQMLDIVGYVPSECPVGAEGTLAVWIYRTEPRFERPDELLNFVLERDVPRKFRTALLINRQHRTDGYFQPSLFS